MIDGKIKIFVDAHCFDQEYQGSRTFIKGIYNYLLHKENIILYLGAYDTDILKQNFPESGNVHFIKYKSRSRIIRLLYDIPAIIRKHGIDYAHFQYISPLIKNCKQIVTIHDLLFKEHPAEFPLHYKLVKNLLFKRSAKKADIITTVSRHSRESICRFYTVPDHQVQLIPNGVGEEFFQQIDKIQARKKIHDKYGIEKSILCVSRIEPRKNHSALINAFLELELYKKGYHLVFIGHISIKVPGLMQLAESNNEAKHQIHFLQKIAEPELLDFYSAAECFVYPSRAEGFGLPPLEAAATGLPVICSNACGMNEFGFFGNGHIDPDNQEMLKKQLSDMLEGNYDIDHISRITEKIKSDYTWKASSEKLYSLITNNN